MFSRIIIPSLYKVISLSLYLFSLFIFLFKIFSKRRSTSYYWPNPPCSDANSAEINVVQSARKELNPQ